MKNFNYFTFLIIVFFSVNSLLAHGPSRQKVIKKIELNANPEKVWKIIGNFSDFSWHQDLTNQISSGSEVGSTRELTFKNKHNIKQSLEKLNITKKMISWRIITSDNEIMPVNSYSATLTIKPIEENKNKSILTYRAAFYRGFMGNDPPEELNDLNSKKKVTLFVEKAIEGLKNKIQ